MTYFTFPIILLVYNVKFGHSDWITWSWDFLFSEKLYIFPNVQEYNIEWIFSYKTFLLLSIQPFDLTLWEATMLRFSMGNIFSSDMWKLCPSSIVRNVGLDRCLVVITVKEATKISCKPNANINVLLCLLTILGGQLIEFGREWDVASGRNIS